MLGHGEAIYHVRASSMTCEALMIKQGLQYYRCLIQQAGTQVYSLPQHDVSMVMMLPVMHFSHPSIHVIGRLSHKPPTKRRHGNQTIESYSTKWIPICFSPCSGAPPSPKSHSTNYVGMPTRWRPRPITKFPQIIHTFFFRCVESSSTVVHASGSFERLPYRFPIIWSSGTGERRISTK